MLRTLGQLETEASVSRGSENSAEKLGIACIAIYLAVVFIVFAAIRRANDGHFLYSLDDPYIHLALAENIARGHYGINAVEPSSPSSTIIWPLMLAPFAATRWFAYVPLIWNIIFGIASSFLIGTAVAQWMPMRQEEGRAALWKRLTIAVLLMVLANLIGLTFLGMEHTLQVLLAICCALGCIAVLEGRPLPTWCLVAAVLAPWVRYEDLILSVAVCIALLGRKEYAKSATILGLSLAPLLLFGLFLKLLGLPMLPTSVMVKGDVYAGHHNFLYALSHIAINNLSAVPTGTYTWPFLAIFLIFLSRFWTDRVAMRRYVFLATAIAAILQLMFGRFGWLFRYEDYVLIFLALILVRVATEGPPMMFGYLALGLLLLATPYITAINAAVKSSQDIYGQQYQMHRFVTEFWHGDYAVNDLGLVSFRKPKERYVLDVYGLASVEASQQSPKTAEWLEDIVRRHNVQLAMIYPDWFDIPPGWIPEARMCLKTNPVVVAEPCVVFYSTTSEAAPEIQKDLARFSQTLPQNVRFSFSPQKDDDYPPND
jgi:hypothetical protein